MGFAAVIEYRSLIPCGWMSQVLQVCLHPAFPQQFFSVGLQNIGDTVWVSARIPSFRGHRLPEARRALRDSIVGCCVNRPWGLVYDSVPDNGPVAAKMERGSPPTHGHRHSCEVTSVLSTRDA